MESIEDETKKCFGFGLNIAVQPSEKVTAYEQEQERIYQAKKLKDFKESGVPEKFWNESFDTYEVQNGTEPAYVKDVSMKFAENPKNRMLILCGKHGNGKTHLLSSILRVSGGEYITSSMLCIKYDSAIGFKSKMSREEIIEHYINVKGVLVIDECCKYFLNQELEKFILLTILCGRYENNKATALGTNTDKQPFIEFLGKAVFDRCTESATTLTFDWESKRKSRRGND